MKVKRHMRDLGHEQYGPCARRLVERKRMAAEIRRLPRVRRCRKVVGKKASVLSSAGLTPSWSHGAATMCLLPSALKTQRTAAAQLLGLNKLQGRPMAFALAPNAKYDPLFAATVPLVQENAMQIWEGRINAGTLVRAHNAWLQRRSLTPTWHGVHGPLGAVIMRLRRNDWSLQKEVALRSDTDELINMLLTPPRRVAALVERGITRWQMRDVARSLAFDPSEAPDSWLRHMRYMLYSRKGLGSACESQHVSVHGHGRPLMSKSDDCAAPPYRPVVLLVWLCARHVCSSLVRMFRNDSLCFAPRAPQARIAWDFDEADTSWSLGIPSVPHPSVLIPDAQEVAIWEAQDDTWVGLHRQVQMEVAGLYDLDGSALNPEIIELRRAGWGFAVLERPELSTQALVPVAPPMTVTAEPTCEPKLLIGPFGYISGDHTVLHAEHISLLRAAQHAARFWKDDGSELCFVSDC